MKNEIERKFLLSGSQWKKDAQGLKYRQGYMVKDSCKIVRVRTCNNRGFLTIKGRTQGITRLEFEYEIPIDDADFLLENFCEQPILEKMRYRIPYRGNVWEIDVFLGENSGLVMAEIELETEDQIFDKPEWIGKEVTGDKRYYNSFLVKTPYSTWPIKTVD